MIFKVEPIIAYLTCLRLCIKEYPGHKKGCPNFRRKQGCPPSVNPFNEVYDLSAPVYAIWNVFNFREHVVRMKNKHPLWSKRQLECCLYWQGTARKELRIEIERFKEMYSDKYVITKCPEGMGVLVTNTMKQIGVHLEWPPKNFTYQIAFAGILKEES